MRVIAIAGGSGSGKSSLAVNLKQHFITQHASCEILCEDSYYHSLNPEQLANVGDYDFDHPDAINHHLMLTHLQQIRRTETIQVPVYCYKTHQQLPETRPLEPTDVLILEGLHLLHRVHLLSVYDMSVFVETPEETRLERRIRRDTVERARTLESVMHQFHKTVKPNHDQFIGPSQSNADLIVDGTKPHQHLLEEVLSRLPG
jgi:uridine kinase